MDKEMLDTSTPLWERDPVWLKDKVMILMQNRDFATAIPFLENLCKKYNVLDMTKTKMHSNYIYCILTQNTIEAKEELINTVNWHILQIIEVLDHNIDHDTVLEATVVLYKN